jgi:hypothetical protein
MADETAGSVSNMEAPVEVKATEVSVINEDNFNSFSSDQIKEAVENMKAGKVFKKTESVPEAKPAEVPSEAIKQETTSNDEAIKAEPVAPVKAETPDFDVKVSEAVQKKLDELGIKPGVKEPEVPKVEEQFHGFKSAEELNQAYEKDPVGLFNKVVAEEVKKQTVAIEQRLMQRLDPVASDFENRKIGSDFREAAEKVKELATDPNFKKEVAQYLTNKDNKDIVDVWVRQGKNPYVEIAKMVRAENMDNYIQKAKAEAVKETETRLSKANRAVVEGGGKVALGNGEINLETASASEIEAYLKSNGRA